MANPDAAFGLRPVSRLDGSPWSGKMRPYYCPSTDSTAIFKGDAVTPAGNANTLADMLECTQVAAGGLVLGVAMAFSNNPYISADTSNLERAYRPASTGMYVWVIDDPNLIWECQEDSGGAALAAADAGLACDIVVGSGSTTTGNSGMEIDSSTKTTSGQLKLIEIAKRDDGTNLLGDQAIWRVQIMEHFYSRATTV